MTSLPHLQPTAQVTADLQASVECFSRPQALCKPLHGARADLAQISSQQDSPASCPWLCCKRSPAVVWLLPAGQLSPAVQDSPPPQLLQAWWPQICCFRECPARVLHRSSTFWQRMPMWWRRGCAPACAVSLGRASTSGGNMTGTRLAIVSKESMEALHCIHCCPCIGSCRDDACEVQQDSLYVPACRYLTPAGALWRFLTFRGRRNRFLSQSAKSA